MVELEASQHNGATQSQKGEASKYKAIKAQEDSDLEKEVAIEVKALKQKRDELEAQLKEVNMLLAVALKQQLNRQEEKEIGKASSGIMAHLAAKEDLLARSITGQNTEAGVLGTRVSFLKETWELESSCTQQKDKDTLALGINAGKPVLMEGSHESFATMRTQSEEIHESFDTMNLHKDLLAGIYASGLVKPTPLQQKGIVPFCNGCHMVVQAPPVPEVRDMFSIGILQQLNYSLCSCQALVLAPTREVVPSIVGNLRILGEHLKVKVHACIGGTSVRDDVHLLEKARLHVVVGTMGRVHDVFKRLGARIADHLKILVIYDASAILYGDKNMERFYAILKLLQAKVQIGIFSSFGTPPIVMKVAQEFMCNPLFIREEVHLSQNLELRHFQVGPMREGKKLDVLCELVKAFPTKPSIVFVGGGPRKIKVIACKMQERGHAVSANHAEMDCELAGLSEFMDGSTQILITTDMGSRSLDMKQECLIVNYHVPRRPEKYLERVLGRAGVVVTFVTIRDEESKEDIEELCNVVFRELPRNGKRFELNGL